MLKTVSPFNTASPTFSGDVTLSSGNLVIGTSGKGIDFSVTPSGTGTMVSELFDDYEEGTWTATLKGSVSDPTTPVTTTGRYTKIGDTVHIWCSFAGVDTTGASGNVTVTGVPFTSGIVRAFGGVALGIFPVAYAYIVAGLYDGSTTVSFSDIQSNGYGDNLKHNAGGGRYLEFSLTYKV